MRVATFQRKTARHTDIPQLAMSMLLLRRGIQQQQQQHSWTKADQAQKCQAHATPDILQHASMAIQACTSHRPQLQALPAGDMPMHVHGRTTAPSSEQSVFRLYDQDAEDANGKIAHQWLIDHGVIRAVNNPWDRMLMMKASSFDRHR